MENKKTEEADLSAITKDLERFAKKKGADLFGVAPLERLREAPADRHPTKYLRDASCVISLGIRLNKSLIENLPDTRRGYQIMYHTVNTRLNDLAYVITRFLEEKGYDAVNIAASDPYNKEKFAGDLSHRHVAQAAGLGEFGLNNLLLTPEYGPRVRFVSVITNAPLKSSSPLEGRVCKECKSCIETCPSGALNLNLETHSWSTGRRIDYERCNRYMENALDGLVCGLCIKACPIGRD